MSSRNAGRRIQEENATTPIRLCTGEIMGGESRLRWSVPEGSPVVSAQAYVGACPMRPGMCAEWGSFFLSSRYFLNNRRSQVLEKR